MFKNKKYVKGKFCKQIEYVQIIFSAFYETVQRKAGLKEKSICWKHSVLHTASRKQLFKYKSKQWLKLNKSWTFVVLYVMSVGVCRMQYAVGHSKIIKTSQETAKSEDNYLSSTYTHQDILKEGVQVICSIPQLSCRTLQLPTETHSPTESQSTGGCR